MSGFFTEKTPLDPHSSYAASKASADMICKVYYDTFGMPINITRCSNNYGPHQFLQHVTDRLGHDRCYEIDPTLIRKEIGWEPEIMFDEGIELTVDWYLTNETWMRNILSKMI